MWIKDGHGQVFCICPIRQHMGLFYPVCQVHQKAPLFCKVRSSSIPPCLVPFGKIFQLPGSCLFPKHVRVVRVRATKLSRQGWLVSKRPMSLVSMATALEQLYYMDKTLLNKTTIPLNSMINVKQYRWCFFKKSLKCLPNTSTSSQIHYSGWGDKRLEYKE